MDAFDFKRNRVRITEQNIFETRCDKIPTKVRILMAKGEKGDQGEKGDKGDKGDPGQSGTTRYEDLTDKPQINDATLSGNKSLDDIGISSLTNTEIEHLLDE